MNIILTIPDLILIQFLSHLSKLHILTISTPNTSRLTLTS